MDIAQIKKQNGKYEVVFPEGYSISGEKMFIKIIGNSILLIPMNDPWNNFFESLNSFSEDFMEKREQTIPEIRKPL